MKRFAALVLAGSLPLAAFAGNPVSVYPPAPAAPASSMTQPLSAAVQSAAATLPPAPTMTSTPSWGSPAVLPGTTVAAPGCATGTCGTVTCSEPACARPVRPYFNLFAPRPGCGDVVRGSCLDRLKDWFNYRSSPGGLSCSVAAPLAPLRTYFPCKPDGCGSGGCGAGGCAAGGCATAGGCGTVNLPVQRLEAGCDAPTCRPRVMYQPLTARAEVPVMGCDARVARPRLFDRMFSLFTPKCGNVCATGVCTTGGCTTGSCGTTESLMGNVWGSPASTVWTTPSATTITPAPSLNNPPLPMSTTPLYGPVGGKTSGKTFPLSSTQPFTNP